MERPSIHTVSPVVPMLYAYTTPEIARHDGWTKIGYTEQDVAKRIYQQTHTADVQWQLEWQGNAIFEDGSGDRFTDKDFHRYLRKSGVRQEEGTNNEWFQITGPESRSKFYEFRSDRGILKTLPPTMPYRLRREQQEAVEQTLAYRESHPGGESLWNAKPRFGKTLSVYEFCQRAKAQTVLIVTNRPAIANSWYQDYMKFLGRQSGYFFVSQVDGLKDRPGVLSREEYSHTITQVEEGQDKCIEFVSLQDLKGSKYFSKTGTIDKLREVADMQWDVLVVDEAHEGIDTTKTEDAFGVIRRRFTIHLSGTPFKALANDKFPADAIYNWTYADEQRAKRDWDNTSEEENPYAGLPRLNLYTYQMSEIVREELQQGIEIKGETEEYAFDLNEFFSTDNKGAFKYSDSVDRFLEALTVQKKYPFSTPELRQELKHTFWLLERVDSAKALARKLKNHPVFGEYTVVLAAGDGKTDDDMENKKAYDRVVEAIGENDKTITLSVGQLTTGITIPEWTAVLMLSNMKSPAEYMQAAFRCQNPCLFRYGSSYARKENAYVFDFDPARTLTIFEGFANDLSSDTSAGRGDVESRKAHVRELLNFFPVIGEDEQGELVELDAEKVLSIPHKIRSAEVVRRGFMSNFLFQNIAQVFGAPQEVIEIIGRFDAVGEGKAENTVQKAVEQAKEDLSLNEEGEVELPEDIVIGRAEGIFGNKIYGIPEKIESTVMTVANTPQNGLSAMESLKADVHKNVTSNILAAAKAEYGKDMSKSVANHLETSINAHVDRAIEKAHTEYVIDNNRREREMAEALESRQETGRSVAEIRQEFAQREEAAQAKLQETLQDSISKVIEEAKQQTVETVETHIQQREKSQIEELIRSHLRGFSRTIPSFLMAYGREDVTLANFDTIVPDRVFREVTSISLDEFRFLRDGGEYVEAETGETKTFGGNLFDPVVFDDSVKEFLALKQKLADYFDESMTEDIFDYIPPQKTNQIFTPKNVVQDMVDMLEKENPGCFDQPDKTFVDLYMKSGLYITEIVKRLYQSSVLKKLYPGREERLRHIFAKQVYGLAPTEIIYRIAISYILGFGEKIPGLKHNFRQVDALPYAKEGTLSRKLDEIYGAR